MRVRSHLHAHNVHACTSHARRRSAHAWAPPPTHLDPTPPCTHCSLGRSVKGTQLYALEISDQPSVDEAEPYWVYIANMHGNEISGR